MISFIKKHYVTLTVFLVAIMVVVISSLLLKLFSSSLSREKTYEVKEQLTHIINGKKEPFFGHLTTSETRIYNVTSPEYSIVDDGLFYYNLEEKIILPKDYLIVNYADNAMTYKLNKYSTIYKTGESYVASSLGKTGVLNKSFIYDGISLFFFLEDATILLDNKEVYITPFSLLDVKSTNIILYSYSDKLITNYDIEKNISIKLPNDYYLNPKDSVIVKDGNVTLISKNMNVNTFMEVK